MVSYLRIILNFKQPRERRHLIHAQAHVRIDITDLESSFNIGTRLLIRLAFKGSIATLIQPRNLVASSYPDARLSLENVSCRILMGRNAFVCQYLSIPLPHSSRRAPFCGANPMRHALRVSPSAGEYAHISEKKVYIGDLNKITNQLCFPANLHNLKCLCFQCFYINFHPQHCTAMSEFYNNNNDEIKK
ncbi:hypothetical protein ALC53_06901 [Atta colombica]|uniref:Uncharacterized protein n=1 Tax=Atta colombica TaxID=520822 RepID=A0A195BDT1_9HYME|nr:hypothetical protein ALC53_06901 [Atta colombica]